MLVSGSGSNMVALDAACRRGAVPGRVVLVVADRDCPGITAAEKLGIPTEVVSLGDFQDRSAWNQALRETVKESRPDLVVSAGFMRILAPVFVDEFAGRIINLHPSLLPAFPGTHAVRDVLRAGARATGTTVHHVDHGVDTGPVILQTEVEIEAGDTEESLHARIKEAEHELLPKACRMMLERSRPRDRAPNIIRMRP